MSARDFCTFRVAAPEISTVRTFIWKYIGMKIARWTDRNTLFPYIYSSFSFYHFLILINHFIFIIYSPCRGER